MNKRRPLFVLDTNIFIDAHRRFYAFDLCPGFWECLEYYCREGRVRSIYQVRDEIVYDDNDDDRLLDQLPDRLSEWVNQAPAELFVPTAEQSVLNAFAEMNNWVLGNEQFQPQAREEFAHEADGWIAAYASVHNAIVITHEVFRKNVKRKVPLPNVCQQFKIDYQDTFMMLRELDVRFDWIR